MPLPFINKMARSFGVGKKAFTSSFGGGPGLSWLFGTLPGSRYNYEKEVGPAWLNSAVSIGLSWITDNFSEPTLEVVAPGANGEEEPVPRHPLVNLLNEPNPYDDFNGLFAATCLSYLIDGNAYWIKERAGARVSRLWWAPHWCMQLDTDGNGLPSQYIYTVRGKEIKYPLTEVVHFRDGKDPENPFYGLGRLKPLLREIYTDNQCSTYTAALLRNYGVPSVLLSPKDPLVNMEKKDRDGLKELWRGSTTGDNVGMPVVPSAALEVTKLALSPEELALDKIRQVPEARVCAALHLSPMLLGLNVGLEQSTYANMEEATRGAYHHCLIPLQKRFAAILDRHLIRDVGGKTDAQGFAVEQARWNYKSVEALAENQDDLAKRAVTLFKGDVLMRNEARDLMGKKSTPEDEMYSSEIAAANQAAQIQLQGDLLGPMDTTDQQAKAFKAARSAVLKGRRLRQEQEALPQGEG